MDGVDGLMGEREVTERGKSVSVICHMCESLSTLVRGREMGAEGGGGKCDTPVSPLRPPPAPFRVTDAKGRTVNFANTIIIMTSNLGTGSAMVGLSESAVYGPMWL